MEIKQFPITIYVDLEINNIQYGNDSIGYYEYGSAKEIDKQDDYIEGFDIDEIIIDKTKVDQKLIFDFLENILIEDENLVKQIEILAKEEAEETKVERALTDKENEGV